MISYSSPAMRGHTEAFAVSGHEIPAGTETRSCPPSGLELTKKGQAYCGRALAESETFTIMLDSRDRTTIATTIERLIDMLDAMETDPDLEDGADDEPSLGWPASCAAALRKGVAEDDRELEDEHDEDGGDRERTLGWEFGSSPYDQRCLIRRVYGVDEIEEENEHGGDILDEPHDETDQGDAEPFLGWSEHQSLHGCVATGHDPLTLPEGAGKWNGSGYREGSTMLRDLRQRRPDVPQQYVRIATGYGW